MTLSYPGVRCSCGLAWIEEIHLEECLAATRVFKTESAQRIGDIAAWVWCNVSCSSGASFVHFNMLFLDGVYVDSAGSSTIFRWVKVIGDRPQFIL
jgi:hypothetical protein